MLVLKGCAEYLVLPIGSLSENGRIRVIGICRQFTERHHIVVIFSIFTKVHHIDPAGLAVDGEHSVIGELRLAGLSSLGRDEYDTVRALGSVDRRGGGILKDFHTYDVGRVDRGQRRDRGDLTVAERAQTEVAA